MVTKLLALSVGVAMLGGAAVADAADVAAPNNTQLIRLTDAQMEKVTAGHLALPPTGKELGMGGNPNTPHRGAHWASISVSWPFPSIIIAKGVHTLCGVLPCLP